MKSRSRRDFLKSFPSFAALLLPSCNFFSSGSLLQCDFLQRSGDGSLETMVKEKYVKNKIVQLPIQSRKLIDADEKNLAEHYIYDRVIPETYAQFGTRVTRFDINYFASTSYAVIPETIPIYASQYSDYCQYATEFLYSQKSLQGLPSLPVTWQLPSPNPKGDTPALIGHSYLINYKFTVQLQLDDGRVVSVEMVVPKPEGGGRIIGQSWHIDKEKQNIIPTPTKYTILVNTYADRQLQVPFSEVTCILFAGGVQTYIDQHQEHREEQDYILHAKQVLANASRLRETITESVALYLTTRIIHQPRMRSMLARTSETELENKGLRLAQSKKGIELYHDVPKAYLYLKRFGLESTVHYFMEDPVGYQNAIRAV